MDTSQCLSYTATHGRTCLARWVGTRPFNTAASVERSASSSDTCGIGGESLHVTRRQTPTFSAAIPHQTRLRVPHTPHCTPTESRSVRMRSSLRSTSCSTNIPPADDHSWPQRRDEGATATNKLSHNSTNHLDTHAHTHTHIHTARTATCRVGSLDPSRMERIWPSNVEKMTMRDPARLVAANAKVLLTTNAQHAATRADSHRQGGTPNQR